MRIIHRDFARRFGMPRPRILVAGLNPHAGEGGHLGREEIEVMIPVLDKLRAEGIAVSAPLPADTTVPMPSKPAGPAQPAPGDGGDAFVTRFGPNGPAPTPTRTPGITPTPTPGPAAAIPALSGESLLLLGAALAAAGLIGLRRS